MNSKLSSIHIQLKRNGTKIGEGIGNPLLDMVLEKRKKKKKSEKTQENIPFHPSNCLYKFQFRTV